jgi:hypothetical protein
MTCVLMLCVGNGRIPRATERIEAVALKELADKQTQQEW